MLTFQEQREKDGVFIYGLEKTLNYLLLLFHLLNFPHLLPFIHYRRKIFASIRFSKCPAKFSAVHLVPGA